MLDLRRLQALHAVVDCGSVRGAAERLGFTASAVSQHVSALAAETKTVLLEPAGRGVRPTAAGRLLAERAADLLTRAASAEAAVAALNAGESGVLRLASFATAGAELVPPALAQVHRDLPGLELGLRVAEREEAIGLLHRGAIDVAVIETHDPTAGGADAALVVHELLVDPFRLVVPLGHRVSGRETVTLRDLAKDAWIDLRCEVGCCRAVTDEAFARAGFHPERAVEADEYWGAQGFVAAGLGLALIPALALGVQHKGVAVLRLPPHEQPSRHVVALTRTTNATTTPVQVFMAALRQASAQLA